MRIARAKEKEIKLLSLTAFKSRIMKTKAQSTTEVVAVLPSSPEPTPSIEIHVASHGKV